MHAEITKGALDYGDATSLVVEPPQRGRSTGHAKSRPVESPYDLRWSPRKPSPVERLEYPPRESAKRRKIISAHARKRGSPATKSDDFLIENNFW